MYYRTEQRTQHMIKHDLPCLEEVWKGFKRVPGGPMASILHYALILFKAGLIDQNLSYATVC